MKVIKNKWNRYRSTLFFVLIPNMPFVFIERLIVTNEIVEYRPKNGKKPIFCLSETSWSWLPKWSQHYFQTNYAWVCSPWKTLSNDIKFRVSKNSNTAHRVLYTRCWHNNLPVFTFSIFHCLQYFESISVKTKAFRKIFFIKMLRIKSSTNSTNTI